MKDRPKSWQPTVHYHYVVHAGFQNPHNPDLFTNTIIVSILANGEEDALLKAKALIPSRPNFRVMELRECFQPCTAADVALWRQMMRGPSQPWEGD